jgi:phage terminase large subunit-like protein
MLERGFKFRRQPLPAMITNSGSDRNSVCWEEHEHAVRVAAGTRTPDEAFAYVGESIDDTTFSYVCALDPGDDPLKDPSCWIKANPLLGVILTEEYLAGVVAQARDMPGKLNTILRLHFCVWTDSAEAWIGREALERCSPTSTRPSTAASRSAWASTSPAPRT